MFVVKQNFDCPSDLDSKELIVHLTAFKIMYLLYKSQLNKHIINLLHERLFT